MLELRRVVDEISGGSVDDSPSKRIQSPTETRERDDVRAIRAVGERSRPAFRATTHRSGPVQTPARDKRSVAVERHEFGLIGGHPIGAHLVGSVLRVETAKHAAGAKVALL